MPGLNGSGFTTSYNSALAEVESEILNAGIPLFEMKPTTLQYLSDKIMGLWAVRVNNTVTSSNKVIQSIDWYNHKGAYVSVDVYGLKGKRFAYVPDDSVWHNRMGLIGIVLGNKPAYEILRYHTQDGFVGGARAIKELIMLRDLTQEWIVRNRQTKEVLHRSFDGSECDEFLADMVRKDKEKEFQVLGGGNGILVPKSAMYKESEHLEVRCVKVPHIQKIVDRAGINWMMDPEWTKEVLPDIKKKITDHFGEADLKERRQAALQYLPEIKSQLDAANAQIEQIKPLVELMKDPNFAAMIKQFAPGVAGVKVPEKIEIVSSVGKESQTGKSNAEADVPSISIEPPATHTELGERDFADLNITSLRTVAKGAPFFIKGVEKKSKEALLLEIREKQGIPDEDASGEADEISVGD